MAFRIPHYGFIAQGAALYATYLFNGEDRGAQYAQALPETRGTEIFVDRQGIFRMLDDQIVYSARVINEGPGTFFTLLGGGLL